jgi:hypothetical protein
MRTSFFARAALGIMVWSFTVVLLSVQKPAVSVAAALAPEQDPDTDKLEDDDPPPPPNPDDYEFPEEDLTDPNDRNLDPEPDDDVLMEDPVYDPDETPTVPTVAVIPDLPPEVYWAIYASLSILP